MSYRFNSTSLSRPGFWIGAVLVFGAILIVQFVVFANPEGVRRCIVMRRVWFNDSLGHRDLVLRDLEALKPAMLGDPQWQDYALRTLEIERAWRQLAATALEMEREGIGSPRWRWHGFRALLILGRDAEAMSDLRPRLTREDLAGQAPCAAPLVDAMDEHAAGRTDAALTHLTRAMEPPPSERTDLNLLRSLRMEWASEMGRWEDARKMRDLFLRETDSPPRTALGQTPFLFSRGRAVEALASLELFRLGTGSVEPWVDVYLERCLKHVSPPYEAWASETLDTWGREREARSPSSAEEFPALPEGETVLRLRGEKDGLPYPFPSQSPLLFPMTLAEPGTHTLILRAQAERMNDQGAFAQVVVGNALEAYTCLPSSERVDRRISIYLPAGRHDLRVGVSPLIEETRESRVRIEEIVVIRRKSAPPAEETGARVFKIRTGPGKPDPVESR